MSALEERYRRLLRLYPAAWREKREDEMVATYLDAAPPEATRPSMRDGLDVVAGAMGVRARTLPPGLAGGARIAGAVGLSGVGLLSALLLFGVEFTPDDPHDGFGTWGPFRTLGGLPWALWIAVALASPFLRDGWSRRLGLLPTLATSLLILNDRHGSVDRPERLILLAMVVLSATALLHRPAGRLTRLAPPLAVLAGTVIALATVPRGQPVRYGEVIYALEWLRNLGIALAAIALAILCVSGLLRRAEGAWAFVLLGPSVLALTDSEVTGYLGFSYLPTFEIYDGFLLGVGVLAGLIALLRLALRIARRHRTSGPQAS